MQNRVPKGPFNVRKKLAGTESLRHTLTEFIFFPDRDVFAIGPKKAEVSRFVRCVFAAYITPLLGRKKSQENEETFGIQSRLFTIRLFY